jgi:hypothetical protein
VGSQVFINYLSDYTLFRLRLVCQAWKKGVDKVFVRLAPINTDHDYWVNIGVSSDLYVGGRLSLNTKSKAKAPSKEVLVSKLVEKATKVVPAGPDDMDTYIGNDYVHWEHIHRKLPALRGLKKKLREENHLEVYIADEDQMMGWNYDHLVLSYSKSSVKKKALSRFLKIVKKLQQQHLVPHVDGGNSTCDVDHLRDIAGASESGECELDSTKIKAFYEKCRRYLCLMSISCENITCVHTSTCIQGRWHYYVELFGSNGWRLCYKANNEINVGGNWW